MAEVCTPHKLLEPATLMEMPVLTASCKWLTVPVQSGLVIGSFSHLQSEVALITFCTNALTRERAALILSKVFVGLVFLFLVYTCITQR